MKSISLVMILLALSITSFPQENNITSLKYIEVVGSAEMEIEPDEIRFQIGIEEYWKEEYEKNKNYSVIIPIEQIEQSLMTELTDLGISKEQIIIDNVFAYSRYFAKDFKRNKIIELILTDFEKVDEILNKVKTKGVNYMRISKLWNKNITDYRKQLKIEALRAAKEKATYLLESIDATIGTVISIEEISKSSMNNWGSQDLSSNVVMSNVSSSDSNNDNLKKIKLRYEIIARFEIK